MLGVEAASQSKNGRKVNEHGTGQRGREKNKAKLSPPCNQDDAQQARQNENQMDKDQENTKQVEHFLALSGDQRVAQHLQRQTQEPKYHVGN